MCISEVKNEDCMVGMSRYPDKYFDLAICDPEYGINRDFQISTICKNPKHNRKAFEKKGWDKSIPDASYFKELFRVSQNQIIWGANYFTKYIPKSMGWVVWDKGQELSMSDGELAFTSFDRALRIIRINRCELAKEGTIHPTQKPILLYKKLLTRYAKQGDKILDTHLGSGSSRIACYEGGFDFYGWEIDKDYFDAQEKRFNIYKAQLKLFVV